MNKPTRKLIKLMEYLNTEYRGIAKEEGWDHIPKITITQLTNIVLEVGIERINFDYGRITYITYLPEEKKWVHCRMSIPRFHGKYKNGECEYVL